MIDLGAILLILPPVLTAVFAYLVARKKNAIGERINKAKIDAEIQVEALNIVKGVMTDMREELRREIDELRKENEYLKDEVRINKNKINALESQLAASDELVSTLKSEIATLQSAIALYKAENERLRGK